MPKNLENGYDIIKGFISADDISLIKRGLERIDIDSGLRNAEKKIEEIGDYLSSTIFLNSAAEYIHGNYSLVRTIIFNKTKESNCNTASSDTLSHCIKTFICLIMVIFHCKYYL